MHLSEGNSESVLHFSHVYNLNWKLKFFNFLEIIHESTMKLQLDYTIKIMRYNLWCDLQILNNRIVQGAT